MRWPRRVAVALLLFVFLAEAALRLIFPYTFDFFKFTEPDAWRWERFRPGAEGTLPLELPRGVLGKGRIHRYHVHINARGLRNDEEFADAPAAGSLRIICLGDSVTFGWGLESAYTYPNLLRERLRALLPGREVEVINAGFPGYASRQGLIWMDQELAGLQPAILIVQYGFNDSLPDWHRIIGPIRFATDREVMAGSPGHWEPVDRGGVNYVSSQIYKLLLTRISLAVYAAAKAKLGQALAGGEAGREAGGVRRVPLADFKENLLGLRDICRKNSIEMILIEPWGAPEAYRKAVRETGRENDILVFSQSEAINRALSGRGPAVAPERLKPLTEQVRARLGDDFLAGHPMYYILVDMMHPGEIGNEIFAEGLARAIVAVPRPAGRGP
ncbi:MAG TPA: GDSL-type esterase/lipase family protein [bacterium]|nr:GDSL-type esterase/lipase family protein [bacterium]